MTDTTTLTNNVSESLDHPEPASTGDATHPTTEMTTHSLSATETLITTIPSDPTLNSNTVDVPLVSQLRETPIDPRVVVLRALFPDYDDLILCVSRPHSNITSLICVYRQSVLDSVRGDQDRAIDALLVMSDPEYKSERRPEPPQPIVSPSCRFVHNLDILLFLVSNRA
jgi:hypothetical protein